MPVPEPETYALMVAGLSVDFYRQASQKELIRLSQRPAMKYRHPVSESVEVKRHARA